MVSQRVETNLDRRSLRAREKSTKNHWVRSSVARLMTICVLMYANGAQLPPTWSQMVPHGSQMAPKLVPNGFQMGPGGSQKRDPKRDPKKGATGK